MPPNLSECVDIVSDLWRQKYNYIWTFSVWMLGMKRKYGDVLLLSVYAQRRWVNNCVCVCLLYLDQSASIAAGRVERERVLHVIFSLLFYSHKRLRAARRSVLKGEERTISAFCLPSSVWSLARSLTLFALSLFTSKHTFNWLHSNQCLIVAGAWLQLPFCQLFMMWIEQLSSTGLEESVISNKCTISFDFISINKEQRCVTQHFLCVCWIMGLIWFWTDD